MSRKLKEIEPTKVISIDENKKIDVSDLPTAIRNQVKIYDQQREKIAEKEFDLYMDKMALEMVRLQMNKAISNLLSEDKVSGDIPDAN
jgi:hypothetical protein